MLEPLPDDPAWRAARDGAVVARLPDLGLLAASGADAAAFLHGQLSSDVKALAPGRGHWTTYNSPKGRMLATLFLYRPDDSATDRYEALLAADIAERVAKRLAMFVLRSKVVVADETGRCAIFGIGGPDAGAVVQAAFGVDPPALHAAAAAGVRVVHWPDGRRVVVAPRPAADAVGARLSAHATSAAPDVWAWLGVRAGVPMIAAATQDLFVAQTANWDALGGLDFRKGCYTGQEIVARTQYLGRLKERLFIVASETPPPAPGTKLHSPVFGEQACGTVVNSAPGPEGGSLWLAVMQIDAASGPVAIGSRDGPPGTVQPLPYALPATSAPPGRVKL